MPELGKTKEGNWKHALCWNLNVKFNSMRWAAKPEKVSMMLNQWYKNKYERKERKQIQRI